MPRRSLDQLSILTKAERSRRARIRCFWKTGNAAETDTLTCQTPGSLHAGCRARTWLQANHCEASDCDDSFGGPGQVAAWARSISHHKKFLVWSRICWRCSVYGTWQVSFQDSRNASSP